LSLVRIGIFHDAYNLKGLSDVGINPKVNNLIKGFHQTKADFIWILDSNAYTEPGCLRRAIHFFRNPKVGLVHHVPCGVELSSFGAYLDSGFLNCNHARMYSVINSLGVASCIIGKSNLFRKSDLIKIGGLEQFGKYMAEDNMIGVLLMNIGLTHQVAPDFVYQSMGYVTVTNFLMRRIRWLRIRKYAVTAATIYEPLSECLLSGILAGLSVQHFFGINFYIFNVLHWIVWFSSDMLVASASYGSRYGHTWQDFPQFVLGWFVLQLIVLPSYIYAMAGNEIKWRNQKYLLKSDGTCMIDGIESAKEGKAH
jgi:ceramide glucosyltransferase